MKEQLKNSVYDKLVELERIARGIKGEDEFLEDVVETKRIQTLIDGKWETDCYKFVVTTGGPHIEIDGCNEEVVGKWGTEEVKEKFTDLAREGYERIAELLDEVA